MENKVTIEQLIGILEEAKIDYYKLYEKKNKAAATRVRKAMQDVIVACKTCRNEVTEFKKSI
jgi:hypothetical protein